MSGQQNTNQGIFQNSMMQLPYYTYNNNGMMMYPQVPIMNYNLPVPMPQYHMPMFYHPIQNPAQNPYQYLYQGINQPSQNIIRQQSENIIQPGSIDVNLENMIQIEPIQNQSNEQEKQEKQVKQDNHVQEMQEELAIPKLVSKTKNKKGIKQIEPPINKGENKIANNLANILDNVLDNAHVQEDNEYNNGKDKYKDFGQTDDLSNVIVELKPVLPQESHYDKQNYPNETYNATMWLNNTIIFKACDISTDSLEVFKTVNTYNASLPKLQGKATHEKATREKAFIYARCSNENDISIETQKQTCLDYARKNNFELISYGYQYDNGCSGRNMINLNKELGFWKDHIPENSHIIIYSVDRLSRNLIKGMLFLEEMINYGISIHFVNNEIIYKKDMTAATKAMVQQELQTAEKYSNETSEKIKRTQLRLRTAGHYLGRPKYGFKCEKISGIRKSIMNFKEQDNIRRINNQYNYYIENYDNTIDFQGIRKTKIGIFRVLCRWCVRNGIRNRNNKLFTIAQLQNIVDTPNDHTYIQEYNSMHNQ